jgi:hypothetical protein
MAQTAATNEVVASQGIAAMRNLGVVEDAQGSAWATASLDI